MTAATKFALLDRSIGWNIVSYACCSLIALKFSINFDIIQKHKRARNQKTMFHAPSLAKWCVPRHFSDSEYLGIKELTLTPDQYLQSLEGVFKTMDTHRFTCSVFLVGRLQATIFLQETSSVMHISKFQRNGDDRPSMITQLELEHGTKLMTQSSSCLCATN